MCQNRKKKLLVETRHSFFCVRPCRQWKKKKMFYVPVTDNYYRLPATNTYIPVYSTSTDRISSEDTNSKLNNDLSRVKRELADLREELRDLRLEKETCRICSSSIRSIECDETCSICYPRIRRREREENYSRTSSPIHYCSICHDYVIDEEYPPSSPRSYTTTTKKRNPIEEDKLSEYLSRQIDLQRLRHRYIPEERPVWIPTAYKNDYPNRRWITRQSHFSEP
jgi:hypothetical protein